jgi:hypothetical protein
MVLLDGVLRGVRRAVIDLRPAGDARHHEVAGRGPTSAMPPRRTFHSCGSSFSAAPS